MAITEFWNDFRFLSNFQESPLVYDGKEYPTVEHAYQAAKALDPEKKEKIRLARTAGVAKRLGQLVDIRPDWDEVKFDIMRECVYEKFAQNELLARKLYDTEEEELIEVNKWHDNVWGDCSCSKCKDIEGKNWLGKILMQVRQVIE